MSTSLKPPIGLKWRSSISFIISTIAIGMFTDLFLYGLLVPVLPSLLRERLHTPESQVQSHTSILLASYAAAQVSLSPFVGWTVDRVSSRRTPFLVGLFALFASTTLLYVGQTFPLLVLARILQGVSASVVWIVGLALILNTVGSENLGLVIGSIFGFISVGELVAPVLGGILYDRAGFGAVFATGFILLVIDLTLRLSVIERSVAETKYGINYDKYTPSSENDEEMPLLNDQGPPQKVEPKEQFIIPPNPHPLYEKYPILHPLLHPRTLTAFLVTMFQPIIMAVFDATLPLHAEHLFGFNSLQSGLLFIPLIAPSLLVGPICGKLVDKYGTKPAAVGGLFSGILPLVLLRLIHPALPGSSAPSDFRLQIAMLCLLLTIIAISISFIGSPALVEASYITEQYHKQNPEVFGKNGPYGKLYAVNSMVFSLGLTVGPLLGGWLRETVGFGHMNDVIAAMCAFVGVIAWWYLGGPPPALGSFWRKNKEVEAEGEEE